MLEMSELARTLRSTGEVLSDDPLVAMSDHLGRDHGAREAFRELREIAEESLCRSTVSGSDDGYESGGRTSAHAWVTHTASPNTSALADQISQHVLRPLETAESFQVVRYRSGERYDAHFDAYDLETARGQRTCRRRGQRLITALVYLNDVVGSGATVFPRLGLRVDARVGRLLVFENCLTGSTERHPDTLHAGEPVEDAEKWIANLWFRERSGS